MGMLWLKEFNLLKFPQLISCKTMTEIVVRLQRHAFLPRQVLLYIQMAKGCRRCPTGDANQFPK